MATVKAGRGKDRAKKERDEVVVSFPPANSLEECPRAFDYEVTAAAEGMKPLVRRVFSTHPYWSEEKDAEPVRCVFGQFELPVQALALMLPTCRIILQAI